MGPKRQRHVFLYYTLPTAFFINKFSDAITVMFQLCPAFSEIKGPYIAGTMAMKCS